ncbi:MAG TPA: ABC transporter permease [Pseudogracilibacillus sp.]|nr:ABC transporter permease [Pseudogracilibacillus sp.]
MIATAFAERNLKEILRDRLNMLFGFGLPVVMLILLSLMQKKLIGTEGIFSLENFVPGVAVFGLTFISLFAGVLISNDRDSSFLTRLFTSPLTGFDYIIGYSYPLLPMSIVQSVICFLTAVFLGLSISINILLAIVTLIPVAFLFISIGLMMGSLFSVKQMNGVGPIFINVVLWLGGIVFPVEKIGGTFQMICNALPFIHSVDLARAALNGNYSAIFPHLLWVIGYAVIIFILAVILFKKKMKG